MEVCSKAIRGKNLPAAGRPAQRHRPRRVCRATHAARPEDPVAFTKSVVEDEAKYVLQTYSRPNMVFVSGHGSQMYDATGKRYLDFAAGIAVNVLGHSDARWLHTLTEQAKMLSHTSNLFHTVPQVDLAKKLVESSFADKVFFCNSGTEANEAAIKFARKWARVQAGVDPYDGAAVAPYELVSFTSCFHGRTLGALTLTYKEQYKTPFYPVVPGHKLATYNDLASADAAIVKGKTAAVFVEPVQGEGGVNSASAAFLRGLRELCDERGALLVFDEVQCGLGRTGKLWGYEHFGVEPDVMSVAKPLAGGLPIGAVLVKQAVADAMQPGDHGSTFAGNPLVCAAANTVFDIVSDAAFLKGVEEKGEALRGALARELAGSEHVGEIRGLGLIVGIQLDQMAGKVVEVARDRGLIVITAGKGDVLRLVPPLTVDAAEIEECARVLGAVVKEVLG